MKQLYKSQIISKLVVTKLLYTIALLMRNYITNFIRILGICKDMAVAIDGSEDVFCIDSKPVKVCRNARAKRCAMGRDNIDTASDWADKIFAKLIQPTGKLWCILSINRK